MTSQIDITQPVFGTPTTQSVRDNFTTAANEISVLQAATTGSPFLSLQGGRMGGPMYLYNDPTDAMQPATKGYVDAGGSGGGGGIPEAPSVAGLTFGRSQGAWVEVLAIAGGTMNGMLTLKADPVNALDAATKEYVDALKPSIIPDAPNDAFFYGRHQNAWAQVLALSGGVLSGSLGVGITPPSDVSTTTRAVFAGQVIVPGTGGTGPTGNGGIGINAYMNAATGSWTRLATGGAMVMGVDLPSGLLTIATASSGTVDTAISAWSGSVYIDALGNLMQPGPVRIPSDTAHPAISTYSHIVGLGGWLSLNAYFTTGGIWKYLASGFGGVVYQDPAGNVQIATSVASGSAGGAITLSAPFTFGVNGTLTVPNSISSGGNYTSNASGTPLIALLPGGSTTNGWWIGAGSVVGSGRLGFWSYNQGSIPVAIGPNGINFPAFSNADLAFGFTNAAGVIGIPFYAGGGSVSSLVTTTTGGQQLCFRWNGPNGLPYIDVLNPANAAIIGCVVCTPSQEMSLQWDGGKGLYVCIGGNAVGLIIMQ